MDNKEALKKIVYADRKITNILNTFGNSNYQSLLTPLEGRTLQEKYGVVGEIDNYDINQEIASHSEDIVIKIQLLTHELVIEKEKNSNLKKQGEGLIQEVEKLNEELSSQELEYEQQLHNIEKNWELAMSGMKNRSFSRARKRKHT
jgi:hypothetical protein